MGILSSVCPLVALAVSTIVSYALYRIGYNLFLHPLRGFPGPFLARITDAYGGVHAIYRQLPQITQRDLKRYGPVMRSGPDRLVFNSAKAMQDIYNNERVTKSDVYLVTMSATRNVCIFNALDRHTHRVRRKLVGSTITERAMRDFEPTMSEQINVFLRLILESSEKNQHVNVSAYIRRLGADIVGHLAFSFPLNSQTEERYQFLADVMTLGNGISNIKMQIPALSNPILVSLIRFFTKKQMQRFHNMLNMMISRRLSQAKDDGTDLYSRVVHQLGNTPEFTTDDIWAEAMFFFPAAADTTATAMCSLFFYLSRYPDCYIKLAEEVRSTFPSGKDINGGPKLFGCTYLRACIDEALRMSPPVSGTLWRKLYDDDDKTTPFIVDGHVVPPGTHVGVNFYTLHHNEEYFPDSYTFKPERWLEADAETRRKMNEAFVAFSTGPRGCGGKAMAYLEASLVIARTIWLFDFESAPGEAGMVGGGTPGAPNGRHRPNEYQTYDIFSSTQAGPNLVFRRRENSGDVERAFQPT